MSDETNLNFELPEELRNVESALRQASLPQASLDQDVVMYQAGWAAAMAELNSKNRPASARSWTWPAIALTFATTTAACLMAMLLPAQNSSSSAIDSKTVAVIETVEEKQEFPEDERQPATRIASNNGAMQETSQERFGIASLFGFSIRNMATARSLRNSRMLSAASAPLRPVSYRSPFDDSAEPPEPLTPSALNSLMATGGTL